MPAMLPGFAVFSCSGRDEPRIGRFLRIMRITGQRNDPTTTSGSTAEYLGRKHIVSASTMILRLDMDPNQGKLLGIAIRSHSRAPMNEVDIVKITEDHGITNDSRGKPGGRQVTVLAAEDWDVTCEVLGKELAWTCRRANLLVEGISLKESTGLTIGLGDVMLMVTGETEPCTRMDETEQGLQMALAPDWRGGVCCRVIRGGTISNGTPVTIRNPNA
jgi:MOSC domain-containing protein YiiM